MQLIQRSESDPSGVYPAHAALAAGDTSSREVNTGLIGSCEVKQTGAGHSTGQNARHSGGFKYRKAG